MADQFREANQFEKKLIIQGMERISIHIKQYIQDRQDQLFILLPQTDGKFEFPQVFFVPRQLIKFVNNFQGQAEIREMGIYFGFIKRSQFRLSIEGAEFLRDLELISEDEIIIINEQGAKAILYGNEIKKEMVRSFPRDLAKEKVYFVLNPLKELISLGLSLIDQKQIGELDNKEDVAINLIDKGYYLREDQ